MQLQTLHGVTDQLLYLVWRQLTSETQDGVETREPLVEMSMNAEI